MEGILVVIVFIILVSVIFKFGFIVIDKLCKDIDIGNCIEYVKNLNQPRELYSYKERGWGHDFTITYCDGENFLSGKKPILVGSKVSGVGWGSSKHIHKNTIIYREMKEIGVIILLKSVKWYNDPADMYSWEGVRLAWKQLKEDEQEKIKEIARR